MQNNASACAKHEIAHRPARSTWVVLLVISGGVALLDVLAAIKSGDIFFPILWIGLVGGLGVGALLSNVLLQWSPEEIRYRSLFRTRTIRFRDIVKAEMSSRARGPFTPPMALMLKPRDEKGMPTIAVNLKLFSVGAVRDLRTVLAANGVEITSD